MQNVAKISVTDLDVEEDVNCGFPPCCTYTPGYPYHRVDNRIQNSTVG
jgi:hypothetical protein